MTAVFLYVRTHNEKHGFHLQFNENASILEILISLKVELLKDGYALQTDLCEISEILTRNGRNLHEYIVRDYGLTVEELVKRSEKYFGDSLVYLEVVERYSYLQCKYAEKKDSEPEAVTKYIEKPPISDPHKRMEEILAGYYPTPFFIPQELVFAEYNEYLNEEHRNMIISVSKLPKIIPVAEEEKNLSLDSLCLEIIVRLPKTISILFYLILALLMELLHWVNYLLAVFSLSAPVFEKCDKKEQPVIVLRIPLFPQLLEWIIEGVFFYFVFQLYNIFEDSEMNNIKKNIAKMLCYYLSFKVITQCSSLVLTIKDIANLNQIRDPLGQNNSHFHYLYDELYRADTAEYGKGGYMRNSKAIELFKLANECGYKFKKSLFQIIMLLLQSMNPFYEM